MAKLKSIPISFKRKGHTQLIINVDFPVARLVFYSQDPITEKENLKNIAELIEKHTVPTT